MKPQDRETAIWLFCFIILMGLFYWLDHNNWYQTVFLEDVARVNARVVAWIFSFLGLELTQSGSTLVFPSGTIEIAESCTGSFVFMIFAAAVLPFPAPWKYRAIGLVLGLAALLVLNLFRISVIVLAVSRFPQSLWALHTIVGQVIVISGTLLFFLWWVKKSQKGGFFSFAQSNRLIYQTLLLFIIGYLGGYWIYGWFLDSGLGIFIKQQIDLHTMWLIEVMNAVFFSGNNLHYAVPQVRLIEGCLSSPMIVLFAAIVFAWPAAWWKKLLVLGLGFLPFFYLYHLLRAVLIAANLGFQSKKASVIYNLYGQVMLSLALFAVIAFFWKSKKEGLSYVKLFGNFIKGGILGVLLGVGLGSLMRRVLIPLLTEAISGVKQLSYDPQQSISLMPDLQLFAWVTLIWLTPGLTRFKKMAFSGIGALVVLAVFSGFVTLNEIFRLTPHVGLIKLGIVLMPFLIYVFLFFRGNRKNE